MQRYLKNHLMDDVSMGDLTRASFYSPWYSYRLFEEMTGFSPARYLRRLRLSASALELRDTKTTVLEVAMKYGFGSVDGYQRSFKKEFGLNPKQFAINPIPITLFIPYEIEVPKERKPIMETKNIFITLINKPKRQIILKRGIKGDEYFSYSNEVGCDVWGVLKSMKCLGEPVCLYLPSSYILPGTSSYVQGVEEPLFFHGQIPDGFESVVFPEATYLMFQGEKFNEEDYCEAIVQLKKAMDAYDPASLGYEWDDTNPRIQLEPIGERGYIEMRAVKKKALSSDEKAS